MNKIILADKFKVDSYLVKTYLTKNGKTSQKFQLKKLNKDYIILHKKNLMKYNLFE